MWKVCEIVCLYQFSSSISYAHVECRFNAALPSPLLSYLDIKTMVWVIFNLTVTFTGHRGSMILCIPPDSYNSYNIMLQFNIIATSRYKSKLLCTKTTMFGRWYPSTYQIPVQASPLLVLLATFRSVMTNIGRTRPVQSSSAVCPTGPLWRTYTGRGLFPDHSSMLAPRTVK